MQYIGYADEILDVAFVGRGDEWLAVASNSPDVKIYSLESMTCRVLHGHKDIVLCLARPPSKKHMLASGSKVSKPGISIRFFGSLVRICFSREIQEKHSYKLLFLCCNTDLLIAFLYS